MIDRVEANFFRHEDKVFVSLSRPISLLNFDYETAIAWGKALLKLGEDAKRVGEGHARMTPKEIRGFEEAILGTPSIRSS